MSDTEKMTIIEAAVEAAYNAPSAGAYVNKEDVRRILEAAAPHMLEQAKADAWDEGATGGLSWDENLGEDFKTPNPYMPTP